MKTNHHSAVNLLSNSYLHKRSGQPFVRHAGVRNGDHFRVKAQTEMIEDPSGVVDAIGCRLDGCIVVCVIIVVSVALRTAKRQATDG